MTSSEIATGRAPVSRKVLLFIPHLQQGGAERQILELIRHLPPRYAPVLCVYRGEARHHYASYLGDVRVIGLGVDEMGVRGLARLVDVLRDEAPAIFHSYRDKANFWARLAALRAPVPVMLTSVRNRYLGVRFGLAEVALQRVSDRVLTNSRGIARELHQWTVPRARVQVIHNFIDLAAFSPPTGEDRARARRHHGFADDELVFLLPGRLAWQKHQLGLAAALALLRRRGALPAHVRIVLAGRRRDQVYSRLVPRAMRALGVAPHVTYLEPVADMRRLYHAADVLLLPSLFEGMSNAALEAHACGLPAIISRAANADGIVRHDDTGFEVRTARPDDLARAIAAMIGMSTEARRAMGARGRVHVAQAFHPARILDELVGTYDRLCAEKGVA